MRDQSALEMVSLVVSSLLLQREIYFLFTGRTGPTKLYHAAAPGEKISYLDVTSLYPFINYAARYPVDNPDVHVENKDVFWQRPEDLPYDIALYKVFVVPPKHLDIPVLPMKLDNRFLQHFKI